MNDLEPIEEGLVRVLKNSARNVRESIAGWFPAFVALPMPRIALQLSGLDSATARAMDALGPAFADQIGATGFLIGERLIELCCRELVDLFPSSHEDYPCR